MGMNMLAHIYVHVLFPPPHVAEHDHSELTILSIVGSRVFRTTEEQKNRKADACVGFREAFIHISRISRQP